MPPTLEQKVQILSPLRPTKRSNSLAAAYKRVLDIQLPGSGRTIADQVARTLVRMALDGNLQAIKELREATAELYRRDEVLDQMIAKIEELGVDAQSDPILAGIISLRRLEVTG